MKKTLRKSLSWLLSVVMIFGVFTFVGHPIYFAGETALQNTSSISSTIFVYGGNVSITCSASGSTGCYEYSVSLKKTDDTQWTTLQKYGKNTTLNFTPPEIADYNICVKVKDNTGAEIKKFFVLRHTKDLVNNSSISSMSIRLGETVNVVASAVGGKGNYQYAIHYKKSTDAKWTTVQNYSSNNTVIVKPMKTTLYDICVSAKDSTEMVEKRYFTVNVLKPIPLENISEVDVTAVQLGKSFTVSAAASGGISPYTYAVYYKKKTDTKWTTAQNYNSNSTVKVTPMKNTAYDICVKVKDNAGAIEEKLFAVSVTNGVLSNTSTISDTEIALGNSLTVRASAKGGVPPYNYAVQYKKVTDTKWTTAQSYGTQAIISVKPVKTVPYDVCVKVKDSNNSEQKKYFTVPVVKNMTAHKMQHIVYKSATCTNNGNIEYWYCSDCQKYFKDEKGITEISLENTIIKAVGHTVVIDPAVAPTDTTEGHTEGSHCSVCGEVFTSPEIIPIPKPEEYTITYNIVGNDNYLKKLEISNPNRTTYTKNDDFSFQPITIEGYEWAGWFDASGEKVTKIQKGTTGDMTLWAKFEKYPYTVTFDSPLVPYNDTNTLTRYVSDTTPLHNLRWDGYIFVGWSDDSGKIIKEIKPGTTEITVHANWMSERNKAWAKKDIGDPIIVENEETNSIILIYEIGYIENVPLQVIKDFGYINSEGVAKTVSKEYSVKTDVNMMKQYTQTVANSTTNTAQWSLSNDWTNSVTVNENYLRENNLSETDAKTLCTTDSENWLVSSGSSGATTTTTYDSAQEYDLHTATGNTKTYDTHDESSSKTHKQSADLKLKAKSDISVGASGNIGIAKVNGKVGLELSGEFDLGYEGSHTNSSADKTGTEEDEGNQDQTGSIKHTGTDSVGNSGWNNSSSYGGSRTVSNNDSVSKTIAERIASEYGYGKTYIKQGGETSSQGTANSSTNSNAYSSAVTYCTEESAKETITYTTSNTKTGYHRLIKAGTAHVFAMVGYDIKTASYFVTTYTVMDDESHDFEDYSYSTSKYDDNQISVIPFEIPYDVEEYVLSRIGESEGLEFSKSGKVTGYNGTEKTVIIPEYHVFDNQDGTKSVVKITSIHPNAFKNNKNITGIQLSDYISEIPANAFEGCTALSIVNMPNITSIGTEAFKGCNSLKEVFLSQKVENIGTHAFENLNTFAVYTDTKNVVEGAANSGAKNIIIYTNNSHGKLNDFQLKVGNETEVFVFNGRGNTFNNLTIDSDANTTVINNATMNVNIGTPLKTSSSEVQLGQVNINSSGISIIFINENCTFELYGESSIASTMGNSMLCRNLEVLKTDNATEKGVFTELEVNGNILTCGNITNKSLINYSGHIIDINEKQFSKYSNGIYTISYNANGGTTDEMSKTVYYGESYGTLPTPTKDYHWFDGWFTAQNGGIKVNSDDIFTGDGDITLYAHWTQKDISNWVLESNVPSGAMIKDTKWTYDLTTTTTSSNSYLYGYTLYNTTWYWSDYGAWSGWQNEAVYGSESREVSTRYIEPTYKTQYNYNRWKSNAGHNWGPCKGTWSGVYCPNYEERGWTDDPLPYVETRYSPQIPGNFNIYGDNGANAWYNEWTRQVQTGGGYTQYTYRDRYKIYTYYFKKVESKESSTEVRTSDSISNVNKWVRYIEK